MVAFDFWTQCNGFWPIHVELLHGVMIFLYFYNFSYVFFVQFLGAIISSPYSNIQFDMNAVQNWEGFWLIFVINFVFHFSFSAISIYQVTFSVVHREVHNKVYPLSAYYVSELIISVSATSGLTTTVDHTRKWFSDWIRKSVYKTFYICPWRVPTHLYDIFIGLTHVDDLVHIVVSAKTMTNLTKDIAIEMHICHE